MRSQVRLARPVRATALAQRSRVAIPAQPDLAPTDQAVTRVHTGQAAIRVHINPAATPAPTYLAAVLAQLLRYFSW